jgi:hypothetical protein
VDDKSDRADADADAAAAAVLASLSARTEGEVGDAPEVLVADAEQGSATADRAAGVRLLQLALHCSRNLLNAQVRARD